MTRSTDHPELLGYADRLSVRACESVRFKISATMATRCGLRLKRIICADPNPAGPGILEENCDALFKPVEIAVQHQPFYPGSCALSERPLAHSVRDGLLADVRIFPTLAAASDQTILSFGDFVLGIATGQVLFVSVGGHTTRLPIPIVLRQWHHVTAGYDAINDDLVVRVMDHSGLPRELRQQANDLFASSELEARICVGARWDGAIHTDHFNGKIEAPALVRSMDTTNDTPVARWDFSRQVTSDQAPDSGPTGNGLRLINSPTRAVTGTAWDGSEMCWRHRPDHYAAIHFHEDDIYDFGWDTSYEFLIPEDMPSGVYAMEIEADGAIDKIPFWVCPHRGQTTAGLCVLIPTFTYAIYGNHARPDFTPDWLERNDEWGAYPHNPAVYPSYGLSTYNNHSDGSGICHASHLRPLFNLRPGYVTFGNSDCSGLRHMQADSHLITWLHHQSIGYDIITDRELHEEGIDAIGEYDVVMTTTHPEYHTPRTLNALQRYTETGGKLMYLGGNGFYWRIAIHPERPDLLEIRRAEDGIRAWAAEPGEYYNAFDGAYGGLWRRNGRPPQQLAGVGFSAQGSFTGSYYRRKNFDPQFEWVFAGVEGDVIGDFGLCGNGAAGFELDRVDYRLGSPEQLTILASSEDHDDGFVLVPEEQLTHITNIPGQPVADLLRADMVYYELPGSGAVFSVGSITFCGSLPVNDFDNDISTLLGNVVAKLLGAGKSE